MKRPAFLIAVGILFTLTACSGLELFDPDLLKMTKGSAVQNTAINHTVMRHVAHLVYSVKKHSILIISLFLTLWLYYKSIPHARLKNLKLNDEEIDLLGVAVDTLSDLWRRLQRQKSKKTDVPIPNKTIH